MKKVNANEMRAVNGGIGLGLLVGGWAAVNFIIQGGAFAFSYHYNKANKKK